MSYLTLEQIKEVDDIDTVDVEIPEWGGTVKVRGMSGRQRSNLEQKISNNAPIGELKMSLITSCTLGEKGDPLFTPADKKWLQEKGAGPIETIFSEICKLSGITEQDVEDAEGN